MKRKTGGFSLVELVVVIAIMGVLIAVVIGGIGFMYGMKARESAEKMIAYLDDARSKSMGFDDVKLKLYCDSGNNVLDIGQYTYEVSKTGDTYSKSLVIADSTEYVLSGDSVEITCKFAGIANEVAIADNAIYIGFDRSSGSFTNTIIQPFGEAEQSGYVLEAINFKQGSRVYTVKCVKTTGKYYIE